MQSASDSFAGLDVSCLDDFQNDPNWRVFEPLRVSQPVHYCADSPYGPYWSITKHRDIIEIEKNVEVFSSRNNIIIGDVPAEFDSTQAFATSDPPIHTLERRAVMPAIGHARVAEMETSTRALIVRLLEQLPDHQVYDWSESIAAELTSHMAAQLLGLPVEDRKRLSHWYQVLVTLPGPDALVSSWADRDAILNQYSERINEMWQQRAASNKGQYSDIVSALVHSPDTANLIDQPMRLLGTLSLIAGANEAARAALSGIVVAFNQFPQQWRKLQNNPQLIENTIHEIFRWQSPILHMRRTVTMDTSFRGQPMRKGDRVVLWYCSGNRDEDLFDHAGDFCIDRPNANRHLAFGSGIHRCLGQHVAKMEVWILLEEMLRRFDRIELVSPARSIRSNFSSAYSEVLVRNHRLK